MVLPQDFGAPARQFARLEVDEDIDFPRLESVAGDLQVELTLKPNTPISERFIIRLETAIRLKIGSLSLFRVRRNVFIIRFTLERSYNEDSAADRIEELPAPYACAPQLRSGNFTQFHADFRAHPRSGLSLVDPGQILKALRVLSLRLPAGENDFSYASARFDSRMDIAKVLGVDRRNRFGESRSDEFAVD